MASYYDRYFRTNLRNAYDQAVNGDMNNYTNPPPPPPPKGSMIPSTASLSNYNTPIGKDPRVKTISMPQMEKIDPYGASGQMKQNGKEVGAWKGNMGKGVAGAASAIPAAYAQGVAGVQDFSVDPHAGFKGSGQGLASGGVVGAIAGGITAQASQFAEVNRKLNDLDTSVNLFGTDATGAPVYQGGAYAQASDTLDALKAGKESMNSGIDPATPVFGWMMGTGRKLDRAKDEIQASIKAGQESYNKADVEADQAAIRRQEYAKRRNRTNRLYNLYRTPQYTA